MNPENSQSENKSQKSESMGEGSEPSSPPPFNNNLDPDNATSPLDYSERQEEGREHFYPEGGPEDPPVDSYDDVYRPKE